MNELTKDKLMDDDDIIACNFRKEDVILAVEETIKRIEDKIKGLEKELKEWPINLDEEHCHSGCDIHLHVGIGTLKYALQIIKEQFPIVEKLRYDDGIL